MTLEIFKLNKLNDDYWITTINIIQVFLVVTQVLESFAKFLDRF